MWTGKASGAATATEPGLATNGKQEISQTGRVNAKEDFAVIVIPAIDLKEGRCVRLRQGRMDSSTIFNDDPPAQARMWAELGAARIHVVDLDGSVEGRPINLDTIERIVKSVDAPVQLGGGIRDRETIEKYLSAGVSNVILGTIAARSPELVAELILEFKDAVSVGVDARDGWVAVEGWTEATRLKATDLAAKFQTARPVSFIYTDIERDGMMRGPNIEATAAFARSTDTPVILSGGVSSMDDIKNAADLAIFGVSGIIVGRALYDGAIDLRQAIALVENRDAG